MDFSSQLQLKVRSSRNIINLSGIFSFRAIDFDYAIIVLSGEVLFSGSVSPVCLPPASHNYDNSVATVTGWGTLRSGGSQPDVLHEVSVKTMTNSVCSSSPMMYTAEMITDQMICAADPGKDSCQGLQI